MNWKRFKDLAKNKRMDESFFILGLDLGNDSSSLAFYNILREMPELLDISGGYGRASMPTVLQYIPESREWIFGEYAVLNNDDHEHSVASLMEKMGTNAYIDVHRTTTASNLLGMYIKELISNVSNINPRAEIAGIVAAVSSYIAPEAHNEIKRAFSTAGYEKELIKLVSDRECILTHYLTQKKSRAESILILDYGSRELRAGVYSVKRSGERINISTENYMFSPELGTKNIDNDLIDLFLEYLPSTMSKHKKWQLKGFLHQNKDLLLQKNSWTKPVKLYFNFAYPPVQAIVTQQRMNRLINPLKERFAEFINTLLVGGGMTKAKDIDDVICIGGGFEMQWVKDSVSSIFKDKTVQFYKNPKGVIAESAAFTAAALLEATQASSIVIHDHHQIRVDLGIMTRKNRRDNFYPLIHKGAFWWQEIGHLNFILNQSTEMADSIKLLSRSDDGELRIIGIIPLDGLPNRPKGATRLALSMRFENRNSLSVTVSDCGFGEIYPSTGYARTIKVNPLR
jgi:molecular chaperone DnaK (HSP70)